MKHIFLLFLLFVSGVTFSQYSGTPIMLSLPMDADTIEEDEPTFVWQTTLSNLQNDPRFNVQLSVVQVGEDQTAAEAIAENNPVFMRQNLYSGSLNYSSIDHELQEGVWYAWQVVLFYNGVQVQQSEVWKFIKAEPVVPVPSFAHLRRKADNSVYYVQNSKLYVCTQERGAFELEATLTGTNLPASGITFTPIDIHGNELEEDSPQLETRYFVAELDELGTGRYRLEWKAKPKLNFILFVEK